MQEGRGCRGSPCAFGPLLARVWRGKDVLKAVDDYKIFAETMERGGQDRAGGTMRSQEFYAERFLLRLEAPE